MWGGKGTPLRCRPHRAPPPSRGRDNGKLPDRAREMCHARPGPGPLTDVITYNALISACEKGKQPERALELFKAM